MKIFRIHLKLNQLLPIAATAVLVTLAGCSAGTREPGIPASAGIQSWYQNGTGGHYVAGVIDGSTPFLASGSRIGTVLTDTNCTPDSQGLSHCHNLIAFEDGKQITIQDNHQMSRHRCLRPGERIRVSLLNAHWVALQTGIPASAS